MMPHEAQDALWYIPNHIGRLWWVIAAVSAACGAVTMFLYMIMNRAFSALLVARLLIVGSLVCFALIPLNSGWLPWGVMLGSVGGLMTAFLIATNWCERHDKAQIWWSIFGRRMEQHDRPGQVLERRSRHIWRP